MASNSDPIVERDFYMYVGFYLTRWAFVEESLFLICSSVLGADAPRAAVVFFRTPTLSSRIELISELMAVRFPPSVRRNGGHRDKRFKTWERLSIRVKALVPLRNSVAHHPPVFKATGIRTWIETLEDGSQAVRVNTDALNQRFELYKSHHKRLRERDFEEENITVEDLKQGSREVDKVVRALNAYRQTLDRLDEPSELAASQ